MLLVKLSCFWIGLVKEGAEKQKKPMWSTNLSSITSEICFGFFVNFR